MEFADVALVVRRRIAQHQTAVVVEVALRMAVILGDPSIGEGGVGDTGLDIGQRRELKAVVGNAEVVGVLFVGRLLGVEENVQTMQTLPPALSTIIRNPQSRCGCGGEESR